MAIEIVIPEPVIPYVRMTQRSKWTDPNALAYLRNKQVLRWYMAQAMDAGDYEMYDKKSLCVLLEFRVTKLHNSDLDNLAKAVLDAAQGIFYKNDNYIDALTITRRLTKEPSVKMIVSDEALKNA